MENNNEVKIPDGHDVYVGFDLAKGTDMNALAILADVNGCKVIEMHYWIPTAKYGTDGVDYLRWVNQGYIHAIEGDVANFEVIAQDMITILDRYTVKSIAYDSRYANMGVVPALARAGYSDLTPTGQGFTLSPATLQIEHWLKRREMNLQNNPVLLWNFRNVTLNRGSKGDVYPDKMRSSGKIDGIVAICDAVMEYLRYNSEPEYEIYIGGI
jgi:phage terminase large subunit-like protein